LHPSGKIYISRDVLFDEYKFPYKSTTNIFENSSLPSPVSPHAHSSLLLLPTPPSHSHEPNDHHPSIISQTPHPLISSPNTINTPNSHSSSPLNDNSSDNSSVPVITSSTNHASTLNVHPMTTRAKSGISKPKVWTVTTTDTVPRTPQVAIDDPEWKHAMELEYNALIKNNTWTLVDPPLGVHIISCKWIFKNKYNSDGSLQRRKARLLARGFNQIEGIDYFDTFSPVVKLVTIRVVLSLAISHAWPIHQLDVNNAFLNGELNEIVYMDQSFGFSSNSHQVCRLHKAIYGLKQAPQPWYQKLSNTLVQLGFKPTISDPSLFTLTNSKFVLHILIYVDDILITGSSSQAIKNLITTLNNSFSLKDLGRLHYFLGIEAHWTPDGSLLLSQTKYIHQLLQKPTWSTQIPNLHLWSHRLNSPQMDPQFFKIQLSFGKLLVLSST